MSRHEESAAEGLSLSFAIPISMSPGDIGLTEALPTYIDRCGLNEPYHVGQNQPCRFWNLLFL